VWLALLVGGVACTACSLVFGTAELRGDGGSNGTDAQPDVTADGAPTDGPGGFCATHPGHTFCDDFDLSEPATIWNRVATPRGTLRRDGDASVSAPFSLLATSAPGDAGLFEAASVVKVLGTGQHVHVGLNMRFDAPFQNVTFVSPLYVWFRPAPVGYTKYEVGIGTTNGMPELENYHSVDGGSFVGTSTPFGESFLGWRRLELDIDLAGAVARVSVDGVERASLALEPAVGRGTELEIGMGYVGDSTSTQAIRFDDVLVDVN
jgi:hypothetical protein